MVAGYLAGLGKGGRLLVVDGLHGRPVLELLVELEARVLGQASAQRPVHGLDEHALEHLLVHALLVGLVGREQRLEHVAELHNHVERRERYDRLELVALLAVDDALDDHVDERRHVLVEQALEALGLVAPLAPIAPLLPVGSIAQVLRIDEDHAATRHCGRRRVLQVAHLEQHGAVGLQADALAVGQREQLVVVHDRVHVLDPERVHVTVVENVAALFLVRGLVDLAEDVGEETVGPVARVRVEYAVELDDRARLGIERVEFGRHAELGLRLTQRVDHHCLAAARRTHDHGRVARHHCLVHLHHLVHLHGQYDVVIGEQDLLHSVVELRIAHARTIQAREQVANEAEKQRHVLEHELGQVHVTQRSHKHNILLELDKNYFYVFLITLEFDIK